MSADNYMLIRDYKGKFLVTDESASSDRHVSIVDAIKSGCPVFDDYRDAMRHANEKFAEYAVRTTAGAHRLAAFKLQTPESCVRAAEKEMREIRKSLASLVKATTQYIAVMDGLMRQPSTVERGKKIAKLLNGLEYVKDHARMFGLKEKSKKKAKEEPAAA